MRRSGFTLEKVNTRRRPMARPEQELQRQLVRALHSLLDERVFWFAVPNGGYRSPVEAAIFVGQGVKAGIPDLLFIHDGKAFGLELKSERGSVSPCQRDVHVRFRNAGSRVEIARSLTEAFGHLRSFGIPMRDAPAFRVFRQEAA